MIILWILLVHIRMKDRSQVWGTTNRNFRSNEEVLHYNASQQSDYIDWTYQQYSPLCKKEIALRTLLLKSFHSYVENI